MLSKELFRETPKHLIKFHDTESEQYAYCESIGCCLTANIVLIIVNQYLQRSRLKKEY